MLKWQLISFQFSKSNWNDSQQEYPVICLESQIPYHLGWLWVPLVLQHLLSATLIHLSVKMTPLSLHAFWRSSCHTLVLQGLPSCAWASSSQALTHDPSLPPESAPVGRPTHPRTAVRCLCQSGVFSLSWASHCAESCYQIQSAANIAERAVPLPFHSHRSIGPLLGLYQYLFCTLSCQTYTQAIYWSKPGHNHKREGHWLVYLSNPVRKSYGKLGLSEDPWDVACRCK